MHRTRVIASIALGLLMTVAAQANEKKVKLADLPPAVQTSVDSQAAGNTVTGFTKDTVDGNTLYKANLVVDGRARVITIAPDGTVSSVQNEIAWESVPADIQTTLTKAAGKGKLSDFSSVSTDGKIVSYNATLDTKGNKDRISVKPHVASPDSAPAAPASDKK